MLLTIGIVLSLGAINAMIPVLTILILLVAAAGLNRGYSLFNFFGLSTLAGINPGGKASIAGKTGFGFPGAGFVGGGRELPARFANRAAQRIKTRIKSTFGKRVAATAIMRAAGESPETSSRAKKFIEHPLTRAIFIDRPKAALSPSKVGAKNKDGFKYPRTQKIVNAVSKRTSNLSKKASNIANSARARKANILNRIKGNPGTKRNRIIEGVKNPKTKLGKAAKTALKIVGISLIGTPVAGAAYGALAAGRWKKSRTPGQTRSNASPPEKLNVFKRIRTHGAIKAMGTDIAAIMSPPLFGARTAKRMARYRSKTANKALETAINQSTIIDERSGKGLNTKNYRPAGNIREQDLSHGNALNTAKRYLKEKGKSFDELSRSEKRELRHMVNADLAPAYQNTSTILTAAPRGIINIIREVASGEKLGDVIKNKARHMGEANNSTGSAKMARLLADVAFLTREGFGAARSASQTSGRWIFSPKNQREAVAHLQFSDEAREAAGLKPLTERQKNLLLGVIDTNISAERHPDALRQHYSRIMGELELFPSSSTNVAQLGGDKKQNAAHAEAPSSSTNVAQIGGDKKQNAAHAEARDALTRQLELIAQNKNTPKDIIAKLSEHEDPGVRAAALGNRNLDINKRNDLVNHAAENIAEIIDTKAMQLMVDIDNMQKEALKDPNEAGKLRESYSERLNELSEAGTLKDLEHLSSNPDLSTEEISTILAATERASQFASTSSLDGSEEIIKSEILDSRKAIEGRLVGNKEISTSDLNMLATNSAKEEIRDAATKALAKKGVNPNKSKISQIKDANPNPPTKTDTEQSED